MRKKIVIENANLKDYCTFHIGGIGKKVSIIFSRKDLVEVVKNSINNNEKFKVIGLGANLLFPSNFDGNIIVNKSRFIRFSKNYVYVSSGVTVGELINKCVNKNLSGLENFSGIPSTIGGAITNNMGAFGAEISDFVEKVYCYKLPNLNKKLTLTKSDCEFKYRESIFKSNAYIILGAKLKLFPLNKDKIINNIRHYLTKKSLSQPINKYSAGSIFKRTDIIPAKIIDELGLKGIIIGDAEISTKHAGFIVNNGKATTNDVLNLIDLIKNEVKLKLNKELELEIEVVT